MPENVDDLRKALWSAGYRPVAVKTGDKRPDGEVWQTRARQEPPEAATRPASSRALNTGILCDGLRAIDIDVEDEEIAGQCEAVIFSLIGMGPVRTRGGGKRLIVYRAREGEPVKRWVAGPAGKVEVLGKGQQFVAYGRHPSGSDYTWREGQDLLRVPLSDVLYISEDEIGAVLDECAALIGGKTEAQREAEKVAPLATAAPASGPVAEGRGRSYALEVLKRLASDLAGNPKGGRNNALNDAAMRCGALAARGWLAESECRQALITACHANGLVKEDGHRACEKTFRSGYGAGLQKPAADPVERDDGETGVVIALRPRAAVQSDEGLIIDEETGEVFGEPEPVQRGIVASDTQMPGLVRQITDWIEQSARRPSRPLAMAAALAVVGALAGRRYAGPTGSATHLYILSLAPTGAGKQHPQDCATRLLKAVNRERYAGPPSFMSMSALIRFLQREPVSLCCMDEFGAFLKRVNSRKASSHERGISEVLRNIWGLSFQPYVTPEWASARSERVGSVSLSILGSSTPDELISALSGDDVSNGFLNRFLAIDGGERAPERAPSADARIVPPDLAKELARIPLNVIGSGDDPEPEIVPWRNVEAEAIYKALVEECLSRVDAGPEGAHFARTAEIAIRLATIVEIGCRAVPSVGADVMRWAADLSMGCAEWLAREAESRMTEELGAAALWNKIEARLRRGPMTARDMQRSFFRNVKNADDIRRLLASMEQAGVIRAFKIKPARGREVVSYALVG